MSAKGKVLVVDDDPLVLKLTTIRLQSAGYDVITRDEALGTSQTIIDEDPDVVLLDMDMPALTGDMLANLIQNHPKAKNVPFIFHSGEDLLTPEAARIAEAIPKAEFCEVPGAGHAVCMEAPEAVNTAIKGHLVKSS